MQDLYMINLGRHMLVRGYAVLVMNHGGGHVEREEQQKHNDTKDAKSSAS